MTPTPGSDEALDYGCTCPVLDNGHGRGDGPFWISGGFPVHDPSTARDLRHRAENTPEDLI